MIPYIGKILAAFLEKVTGVSSSLAADHLFHICPPPIKTQVLPEDQARAFHHTTAQLLFLSRVCQDIHTTVAFLKTRAKQPDEDDWGKLKSVLKYLCCTCSLPLTLFADSLTSIVWYVDASHQTHDDCKGHRGSILTFGRGAFVQKVLQKVSSLVFMTNRSTSYGPISFLKHRVLKSLTILSIRTT
jgi:hypothetical protein